MDTKVIVGSPNINGNIGSCEIKSTSFTKDWWHSSIVAVDSCSGKIITENIVLDFSNIFLVLAAILFLGIMAGLVFKLFDRY